MESKVETREEIITGLKYVKTQIENIISETQKQVEIVANFRQEKQLITTSDNKSKLKIAIICLFAAYLLLNVALSFATGPSNLIISVILGAVVFLLSKKGSDGKKHKKLLKFVEFVIIADVIWFYILVFLTGNVFIITLSIAFIVASVFVVLKVIKKKNEKIEIDNAKIAEYNNSVQRDYDETVEKLNLMKNELYDQTAYWYPKDYYSLEAVDFFLASIQNYKADSIKEMVLLFDETQYKNEMLSSQRAIAAMSQQQIINQNEMNKQLKFANILNIANLALNFSTIGAIKENTEAVFSNTVATKSAAMSINKNVNNAANNILNSVDKLRNQIKK